MRVGAFEWAVSRAMSRVIVTFLTGSRDERCLNKEMDGTGKCENRGCTNLAIAEEWKRAIDENE